MTQLPPIPIAPRARKPLPPSPTETACPAPRAKPLPWAVPHPAHLPPMRPPHPVLLACAALALAPIIACAQLDLTAGADAGLAPSPAKVTSVFPSPGDVSTTASFVVSFSTPMDASLLLSDVARSETVVLVAQSNAEVIAAALEHSRLTAAEGALVIPARATLGDQALSLTLTPTSPLAPGFYALLASPRLKSAAGQRMQGGGAEFIYSVASSAAAPRLVDPPAGSFAPSNLLFVRVSFSVGSPGGVLSLVGAAGLVAASAAPALPGEAVLSICPEAPCSVLLPGQTYSLELDGKPVEQASFTTLDCARTASPVALSAALEPRDDSALLHLSLDSPARVVVQVSPIADTADAGTLVLGPASAGNAPNDCSVAGCIANVTSFASCAPRSCTAPSAPCALDIELADLSSSSSYIASVWLEDDEGNTGALSPMPFATLGLLPVAIIDEVMASPPLPVPRDEGEYVEIHNGGSGAIDLSLLGLQGPDGVVRPLLAATPPSPPILEPGGYALAVGASFDASRYLLPPGVPVLRASTQRLLAHGLTDESPPAMTLVAQAADGGTPIPLSSFPGGAFNCPVGVSLERAAIDSADAADSFNCGAVGGSPGRAP